MGIEARKEVWNRGGEEFRGGFGTFTHGRRGTYKYLLMEH